MKTHAKIISCFVPETKLAEAEKRLAALVVKARRRFRKGTSCLKVMAGLSTILDADLYADLETEARKRRRTRDPKNRPFWQPPRR